MQALELVLGLFVAYLLYRFTPELSYDDDLIFATLT